MMTYMTLFIRKIEIFSIVTHFPQRHNKYLNDNEKYQLGNGT